MHEWALTVEKLSTILHADLKRGAGPSQVLELLQATSDVLAIRERGGVATEGMLVKMEAARAAFQRYVREGQ